MPFGQETDWVYSKAPTTCMEQLNDRERQTSHLDVSDELRGKKVTAEHHDVEMTIIHVKEILTVVITQRQPAGNSKPVSKV